MDYRLQWLGKIRRNVIYVLNRKFPCFLIYRKLQARLESEWHYSHGNSLFPLRPLTITYTISKTTAKRCQAQRLLGFRKMRLIFGRSLMLSEKQQKRKSVCVTYMYRVVNGSQSLIVFCTKQYLQIRKNMVSITDFFQICIGHSKKALLSCQHAHVFWCLEYSFQILTNM